MSPRWSAARPGPAQTPLLLAAFSLPARPWEVAGSPSQAASFMLALTLAGRCSQLTGKGVGSGP